MSSSLIQTLITFHFLQTMILTPDINTKLQPTRPKPHHTFHTLVSQQPVKHTAWMVFTDSQIFYLPLNKHHHSPRLTTFHWRRHLQWHNTVSTVEVCKEPVPGKYRLLYVDGGDMVEVRWMDCALDQQVVMMEWYDLLYLALMQQDTVQLSSCGQSSLQPLSWSRPGMTLWKKGSLWGTRSEK